MQIQHVPPELAESIRLTIIDKLVGKPVIRSDSLKDLVRRHCPEVFDMAEARGCKFIPNDDSSLLEAFPPDLRWEIVSADALH